MSYSIFLFLLAFLIYIPSLNNDFVWDDPGSIKNDYSVNRYLEILNPKTSSVKLPYYRPNIYLSYLIDFNIWGKSPFGFHLTNNLLNSTVVFLTFWFIYYFFINIKLEKFATGSALIASLLFLLHPIHVESVSWVSARTDIMSTLFLVMGMLFHTKSVSKPLLTLLALAAFCMSLMSKEIGVVFLPIILVCDFATRQIDNKNSYLKYLLYSMLIILYFYSRSQGHINITKISDRNIDMAITDNLIKYLDISKVFLSTYYTYIYKMIFPVELNAYIHQVTKDNYYVTGSLLFFLIITFILAYSVLKKYKPIYFGLFWILLTLGPSSLLSIITMTPTSLAERYLYLPSVGFCLLLGYLLARLLDINRYRYVTIVVIAAITCFYTVSTYNRQKVWASELSLWKDATIKSKYACMPHNNYGVSLRKAGHIKEAIHQYLYVNDPNIICNDNEKSLIYNNLGTAVHDIKKYDDSIRYYEYSIKYNKYYFRPHLNLGATYLSSALITGSEEDFKRAEYYLNNAIQLKPTSSESHHYLSILYKEWGKDKLALIHAEKALKLGLHKPLRNDSFRIINELQNKKP